MICDTELSCNKCVFTSESVIFLGSLVSMTFSERILFFFLIKLFYIYLDLVKGKLDILKMDVLVKIAQYINMDTQYFTLYNNKCSVCADFRYEND